MICDSTGDGQGGSQVGPAACSGCLGFGIIAWRELAANILRHAFPLLTLHLRSPACLDS
jgi:hypothetical protein